jgi:hypothetical protein
MSPPTVGRLQDRHLAVLRSAWTSASIVLSVASLSGCSEPQVPPAYLISDPSPRSSPVAAPTAAAARKQNWNCQRIEREMADLGEAMRLAKTRAEIEQEQLAPTLARMVERFSGPPGAGNGAFGDFEAMRGDVDQLNGLLQDKGCATVDVGVEAPALQEQ